MVLVGIHGQMGVGKDTVAGALCRHWGFVRCGFADALKDEVAVRLRKTLRAALLIHDPAGAWPQELAPPDAEAFWTWRIRWALWTEKPPVVRALLQEYGTDVRRADDPDYWVRAWSDRLLREVAEGGRHGREPRVVAPDVRFRNEADWVRRLGGLLVKVVRPGRDGDAHASETDLAAFTGWDLVLTNDGTLAELEAKTDTVFTALLGFRSNREPHVETPS